MGGEDESDHDGGDGNAAAGPPQPQHVVVLGGGCDGVLGQDFSVSFSTRGFR